MPDLLWFLTTFQQWTLFCGVTTVVGCVAWRAAVSTRASGLIPQEEMPTLVRIRRRVASVGALATLGLIGVWALRMVVQIMGFRDPFAPLWDDVSFLLFETFWGSVWIAQGITLLLLAAAFWLARGSARGWGWWAAGGLALGLAATLSLSSHAMGVASGRPLIVLADGVHTLAAGSWIGSLAIILTAGRVSGSDGRLFSAQVRSFSPMAIASVLALTCMGVVLAWTHLPTISDLWTTGYGRVLSAKIGVAGLVLLTGLWNWRRGLPVLDSALGAVAVQRRAALEVSFAIGVLMLTAILVHSVKP